MDWLNFHHLRLFWVTAREGNLTRASERLSLAPSTVSSQIRALEDMLGHALFDRRGRGLVLTEHGRIVKEYADDIFGLGDELVDVVRSGAGPRHSYRLRVGVANNLPKLVAYRLLSPAIHLPDFPVHLVCIEDRLERLVADLGIHHLDLVLADAPVGLSSEVDATSRLLGECGVTLLGAPALARRYGDGFPENLHQAPLLLPEADAPMRRLLDDWFEGHGIRPRIIGEFGDNALMSAFGQEGAGLFPAPTMVRDATARQYEVAPVGELARVRERFYAIILPGRLNNPAVRAVLDAAEAVLEH